MKDRKFSIIAYGQAALGLLLTVGTATFMQPCAHMDGNFGTCHWAGQVLAGLGAVITVQAIISIFSENASRREGVSFAMLPVALLIALLPNAIIPLCAMGTMRCNTVMRPAAIVFAVAISVLSVVDMILRRNRAHQEKKG